MFIRRKSDALVLCREIHDLNWWHATFHRARIDTVTGNPYYDVRGVAKEQQKVRLYFADHYADSTLARFKVLWQAQRRKQALQFQDRAGNIFDVTVKENVTEEAVSRWDEVRSKVILIVECHVEKLEYIQ